jgi:hypothetical protein
LSKQKLPAWFQHLDLPASLLVLLAAAQSRYSTVLVDKLSDRWTEKEVENSVNHLLGRKSIELESLGRVRLRVTCQGRNEAARARDRAKKLHARKAAA